MMHNRIRSARPSPYLVERSEMPTTGLTGYYFPYESGNGYSIYSYDRTLSDGVISREEVECLVREVNASPYVNPIPFEKYFCAGMLMILVGLIVGIIIVTKYPFALLGVLVIIGIGIGLWAYQCRLTERYKLDRDEKMKEIIEKHKNTTFSGKNIDLKLSPYGSYIALEFLWKENGTSPYLEDEDYQRHQRGEGERLQYVNNAHRGNAFNHGQAGHLPPGFTAAAPLYRGSGPANHPSGQAGVRPPKPVPYAPTTSSGLIAGAHSKSRPAPINNLDMIAKKH